MLADTSLSPRERVRAAVHAFVASECEEAVMRQALEDAAPLYRDAPEALAAQSEGATALHAFLRETAPDLAEAEREVAAEIMVGTLKALGKSLSLAADSPDMRAARTEALANMLCAYLASLAEPRTFTED